MSKDPFGFDAVAAEPDKPLDISSFAPKARKTDVVAAKAVREVARDAGKDSKVQRYLQNEVTRLIKDLKI